VDGIPGVGAIGARVVLAEIGLDMTRFPTAAHLASWARFAPTVSESAGKKKGRNATGHGNPYLARVLGEAAVAAGKTGTFLGERYRRIARRRGKKRAIVAVGRSILIIIWHLLSDPQAEFVDLGPDHYDTRGGPQRSIRNHVRHLEAPRLQGHPATRRLTRTAHPNRSRTFPAPPGAVARLVTVHFRTRNIGTAVGANG
jgi:transposase